jgi:putative DNA primase/helicase
VNTHSTQGEFRRDLLPDAETYFKQAGLVLVGHGNQRQGPCPIHGGSDSLSVNLETGCFFCFACGAKGGDMLDFHRQVHDLGFVEAARELGAWIERESANGRSLASTSQCERHTAPPRAVRKPETLRRSAPQAARAIIGEAQALAGTIGAQYLTARGCATPPADSDLRFHMSVRHESGYVGPALVAQITDAATGDPMGVHRTWVTDHGKADVAKPKMVLGPKQGGVIRLWPDEAVTTGLAIAEGIETALTIAHDYRPVWSLIDAGNMAAFPVLAGIETLVIGADNDPAGLKGAKACADRWAAAGVDVRVLIPESVGADWNNVEVAQ